MKKLACGLIVTLLVALALCPGLAHAEELDIDGALSSATYEPVQEYCFINTARTQAIAITSWDSEWLYDKGSVWLVRGNSCKRLYTAKRALIPQSLRVFNVKKGVIVTCEEGAGGSSSGARVFFIKGKKAKKLANFCSELRQTGKNEFIGIKEAFDLSKTSGNMMIGHSYKPYYYKWNGKRFVEYGGKVVSKAKFKKAKNGKEILAEIAQRGKVGKIYYRANGIVNVNYSNKTPDGIQYHNVTLMLSGKALSYFGSTPFDLGFGGSYKKSGGGVKVSYPKRLPKAFR